MKGVFKTTDSDGGTPFVQYGIIKNMNDCFKPLNIKNKGDVELHHFQAFSKDLFLYSGSTFVGSIILEDIHGHPFFISKEDKIFLFIKKIQKNSCETTIEPPLTLTLTSDDEINGEYPFKLNPDTTRELNGDYYYYAYIRFADGDYYQIVPHTHLHASVPYGVIEYSENKNKLHARVPRVMAEIGYESAVTETMEFINDVTSNQNTSSVYIRHISGADIILIGDCPEQNQISLKELVTHIHDIIEYYRAKNPYITGLFHSNGNICQENLKAVLKEHFPQKYIDVEEILKTPVWSEHSEMIVSSIAIDLLGQKAMDSDVIRIAQHKYPECIMQDETHFNEKGCYAAAKIIVREAIKNDI